jgi:enamine deaminase RidA (YjgF/YER057c/UK114 family)
MSHVGPIPAGAKIGNMVFSSAIPGTDLKTNVLPSDPDAPAGSLFRNLRRFLDQVGATPDNIGHMFVWLKDRKYRDNLDKEWAKMFPDENDRPARHSVVLTRMPGEMLFQVEVILVP